MAEREARVAGGRASSTLNAIFRVALYRFATESRVVGGFDAVALAGALRPKKRGRRQPAF
jgi:hypothetical protein